MNIIAHSLSDVAIEQRETDGYINATALTAAHKKATGKRREVSEWLENKRTQDSLKHLSSNTGIPVTELYQVIQGGTPQSQGTWLHPKLSVRFAIWLSDDFGYQVENWVETWLTSKKNPLKDLTVQPQPLPVIMPTAEELEFMRSRAWEKAEMEGKPMSSEEIKSRSGYGRAFAAARQLARSQQKRIGGQQN